MSETISEMQIRYIKRMKLRKRAILFIQIAILILFFALWEFVAARGIIDPFIFSQPSRMFYTMVDMIKNGIFFNHIGITIFETVIGFMLGTVFGILFAILLWWNKFISEVFEPYLVVLNSLPKTALAPIIIVWLGNSMKSIIATALLTSIIVTILTVLNGFLEVNKDKIKLVVTFGSTKFQVLSKVVLPASVPTMINALKINVGLSFVGVIVGEFLVAKSGLGYLIIYGSQIFKLDIVMLSVVVLCIFSALLYKFITIIEKVIIKKRY